MGETSNLKGMRTPKVSTWGGALGGSMDNYPDSLEKLRHLVEKYGGNGLRLFDDFNRTALESIWAFTEGSDTAATNTFIAAGGHATRLTTAAGAGASYAVNGAQLTSAQLQFLASTGLLFRTRFKISSIVTCKAFFGFTDTIAFENAMAIGALDALTTTATDAVLAVFDTGAATDVWQLCGVKTDVDATKVITALAPVAATYEEWEIFVNTIGTAYFYRNGILLGTVANATSLTAPLTPVIAYSSLAASAYTMDIDYLEVIALDR